MSQPYNDGANSCFKTRTGGSFVPSMAAKALSVSGYRPV